MLSLAKFRRILAIDTLSRTAVVQPGVRNLAISEAAAPHGLYYAPDPSSQIACSIGGNVAENAGGVHCLKYGLTVHNVRRVRGVLIDGSVVEFGGDALDGPGYDLLALITEAHEAGDLPAWREDLQQASLAVVDALKRPATVAEYDRDGVLDVLALRTDILGLADLVDACVDEAAIDAPLPSVHRMALAVPTELRTALRMGGLHAAAEAHARREDRNRDPRTCTSGTRHDVTASD